MLVSLRSWVPERGFLPAKHREKKINQDFDPALLIIQYTYQVLEVTLLVSTMYNRSSAEETTATLACWVRVSLSLIHI